MEKVIIFDIMPALYNELFSIFCRSSRGKLSLHIVGNLTGSGQYIVWRLTIKFLNILQGVACKIFSIFIDVSWRIFAIFVGLTR